MVIFDTKWIFNEDSVPILAIIFICIFPFIMVGLVEPSFEVVKQISCVQENGETIQAVEVIHTAPHIRKWFGEETITRHLVVVNGECVDLLEPEWSSEEPKATIREWLLENSEYNYTLKTINSFSKD